MIFDQNNKIILLCAEGMLKESEGKHQEASQLFMYAWEKSENNFEKFISAHYVARQQKTIEDKLKWDEISLDLALKIDDKNTRQSYPSLYLNVAKCHEDLNNKSEALKHYELAATYAEKIPDDGYGNKIKDGINAGISRMKNNQTS